MLSAAGAIAIALATGLIVTMLLLFGVVLATGNMPSLNPGHPLVQISALVSYGAGGWFAWWRLSTTGRPVLRRLSSGDLRTIGLGLLALVIVRIGTVVQLVMTHQTKHVQSGFEHFDVVTKTPLVTAIGVGLAVISLVMVGPLVEELVFRGLLFGALARPLGVIGAALLAAVIFGGAHGDPVLFPALAALGFVSALAYAATGNLSVSVALHAANNALGAAFLVAMSLRHH